MMLWHIFSFFAIGLFLHALTIRDPKGGPYGQGEKLIPYVFVLAFLAVISHAVENHEPEGSAPLERIETEIKGERE